MTLRTSVKASVYEALTRTRLRRHLLHRYDYMFEPAQLVRLVELFDESLRVPGHLVEVGCAYGWTTVFLNRYLHDVAPDRRYFAIDTFDGFTADDISVEHERGRLQNYDADYRVNSVKMFARTMKLNGINRVTPIEADAKIYDFSQLEPIAFCLIDVDLYQPVLSALEGVYESMADGGIIVVDDCNPESSKWRGGYEAYTEFVSSRGLPQVIERGKLGIVRKAASR